MGSVDDARQVSRSFVAVSHHRSPLRGKIRHGTMWVVDSLKEALAAAARVIGSAAKLQTAARSKLVGDLQRVCIKCDAAYGTVLERLAPVKNSFNDPTSLSHEMRLLAGDQQTRAAFAS